MSWGIYVRSTAGSVPTFVFTLPSRELTQSPPQKTLYGWTVQWQLFLSEVNQ